MPPTPPFDALRACPRCATTVRAEQGHGASGVTYLWRCDCGWSSVRTFSASSRVRARQEQRSGVYSKPQGEVATPEIKRPSGTGR